jgi:nucleotide-binding universal stress UspA family protein
VPSEMIVRFGKPSAEILVEADAFGADMIVLTTGRQGWLKRVTGGGLGERILRVAPVPVLLVRGA